MARNQTRLEYYDVCLILPSTEKNKLFLYETLIAGHDSSRCISKLYDIIFPQLQRNMQTFYSSVLTTI